MKRGLFYETYVNVYYISNYSITFSYKRFQNELIKILFLSLKLNYITPTLYKNRSYKL